MEKQRTEAWLNVIPTKEGESTSVYISQPVPCTEGVSFRIIKGKYDLEIVLEPVVHVTGRLPGPHGEQVGHERGEAGGEAGLANEAELEFRQADHVIPVTQTPAGDVHQIGLVITFRLLNKYADLNLVVILHQLDDHSHIMGVVLDGDDAHYVC